MVIRIAKFVLTEIATRLRASCMVFARSIPVDRLIASRPSKHLANVSEVVALLVLYQ